MVFGLFVLVFYARTESVERTPGWARLFDQFGYDPRLYSRREMHRSDPSLARYWDHSYP